MPIICIITLIFGVNSRYELRLRIADYTPAKDFVLGVTYLYHFINRDRTGSHDLSA